MRVLIAEDSERVGAALGDLLRDAPGVAVVGHARDGVETVEFARESAPQVVLMDVRMPGGGGVDATRELLRLAPAPRVIAISASDERQAVLDMLEAGAIGYLVKGGPVSELVEAIHRAERGETSLSPAAAARVLERMLERLEEAAVGLADRDELAERVRAAIERQTVQVAFQPILELERRRPVGYEALARFTGDGGRGPAQWFSDAHHVGLGVELELAAIAVALAEAEAALGARLTAGDAGGFLAVNASPRTVSSAGFAGLVAADARLVVEVTEKATIADYGEFRTRFARLREAGLRLAIDDVGAGRAGLRHVLQLEPDVIKMDLSLTRDVDRDESRRAMARALIMLAEEAGAVVVAEGIETEAELETLLGLGAAFGQGFHLGRPGPLRFRTWPGSISNRLWPQVRADA